ncbi:MAG: NAD(+) diphosphatase [Treponema sp.]|nr:NAD(+) diphosphatase [Treponema sp.]
MSDRAFFFQGDSLLLPVDFPDSQIETGVPRELAKNFGNPGIFEIPALNVPADINQADIYQADIYQADKYSQLSMINVVSVLPETNLPAGWRSVPVRQLLAMLSADGTGKILRACHVAQWRNDSRFCGRCGAKNTDVAGDAQRLCPKCGKTEFPRICPAVIIIITDSENKILLAHNKKFTSNVYSHISGFNEAGETLEETVVREIREEVNITVKDIEYIKSQPWPFPCSLMIGYKARYLSGTVKPDGVEIEDAKWFAKDNLPDLPREGSLSRYLINCWLNDLL